MSRVVELIATPHSYPALPGIRRRRDRLRDCRPPHRGRFVIEFQAAEQLRAKHERLITTLAELMLTGRPLLSTRTAIPSLSAGYESVSVPRAMKPVYKHAGCFINHRTAQAASGCRNR